MKPPRCSCCRKVLTQKPGESQRQFRRRRVCGEDCRQGFAARMRQNWWKDEMAEELVFLEAKRQALLEGMRR